MCMSVYNGMLHISRLRYDICNVVMSSLREFYSRHRDLLSHVSLVEYEWLTLLQHLSSPEVSNGVKTLILKFSVQCFYEPLFLFLSFFFWSLCCLFFFDLRLLTLMIYSNFSCLNMTKTLNVVRILDPQNHILEVHDTSSNVFTTRCVVI